MNQHGYKKEPRDEGVSRDSLITEECNIRVNRESAGRSRARDLARVCSTARGSGELVTKHDRLADNSRSIERRPENT